MSEEVYNDGYFDEVIPLDSRNKKKYKAGFIQWSVNGDRFYPTRETTSTLPSGFYIMGWDQSAGTHFLKKRDIITEDIFQLPDKNFENIIGDVQRFWSNKKIYKKYNFVYKRGILLYGTHGCGKSSLIQLLCKDLINIHQGIVINISDRDDVFWFDDVISMIRDIEREKPVIVIIEDIDNFIADREVLTTLLNILDGNMRMNNVVTIATTNFIEDVENRIKARPSRFDRRYNIGLPDDVVRKYFIEQKIKENDLVKSNVSIDKIITDTKGFTIDHLKELILSICVLGYDYDIAFKDVKDMLNGKNLKVINPGETSIGFNINKE